MKKILLLLTGLYFSQAAAHPPGNSEENKQHINFNQPESLLDQCRTKVVKYILEKKIKVKDVEENFPGILLDNLVKLMRNECTEILNNKNMASKPLPCCVLLAVKGTLKAFAFNYDGNDLLTLSTLNSSDLVQLWNFLGEEIIVIESDKGEKFLAAIFSPDGNHLMTCTERGKVNLYNMNSGRTMATNYSVPLVSAEFGPDSKTIMTYSKDNKVNIYDLIGNKIKSLDCINGLRFTFSPNPNYLLRDIHEEKYGCKIGAKYELFCNLNGDVIINYNAIAFNPDGTYALTHSSDNRVRLWDLNLNYNSCNILSLTLSKLIFLTRALYDIETEQSNNKAANLKLRRLVLLGMAALVEQTSHNGSCVIS